MTECRMLLYVVECTEWLCVTECRMLLYVVECTDVAMCD